MNSEFSSLPPPRVSTPPGETPSLSSPLRRVPRLPGTYAAHYEREADWRRGRNVLIVVGLLGTAWEIFDLIARIVANTGISGATLWNLTSLVMHMALLLTILLGANWTRWPLAIFDFCIGGWLVVYAFMGSFFGPLYYALLPGLPDWLMLAIPPTIGVCYLVRAGWLAFSADLTAFTHHQREHLGTAVYVLASALALAVLVMPASGFGALYWFNKRMLEARQRSQFKAFAGAESMARRAVEEIVGSSGDVAVLQRWLTSRLRQNAGPAGLQEIAGWARAPGAFRRVTRVEYKQLSQSDAVLPETGDQIVRSAVKYRITTDCEKQPAIFHLEMVRDERPGVEPQPDDWRVDSFYIESL